MKLKKYLKDNYYVESSTDVNEVKKQVKFEQKTPKPFFKLAPFAIAFVSVFIAVIAVISHGLSKNYSSSSEAYDATPNSGEVYDKIGEANKDKDQDLFDNDEPEAVEDEAPSEDRSGGQKEPSFIIDDKSTPIGGSSSIGGGIIPQNPISGNTDINNVITSYKQVNDYVSYQKLNLDLGYDEEFFNDNFIIINNTVDNQNYSNYEIKNDYYVYLENKVEYDEEYKVFVIQKSMINSPLSGGKCVIIAE